MRTALASILLAALPGSAAMAQSDVCATATLIACGATVTGNTALFTADVAPFCGTTDGTGGGVWYRFVGTGQNVTASLCGSAYDTKIRVYSGTCAAPVCVTGIDDFCGLQSEVTWASVLAVNYYILVHGFGAGAGNYTLTLTCAVVVPLCYALNPVPYAADPYAGTPVFLTDDVHSGVVNIGFTFCYNGANYNQCVISSNNYVTFNLAQAGTFSPWVTVAVPNVAPAQIRTSILNPWQDIDPAVGGSIYYQTLGVAPNRRFVVSYLNVPMFSCNQMLYTSQTVLYEGSNCIGSYILSKPICATWNSGRAVHALHNTPGNAASVVPGRNNTQWAVSIGEGRWFSPTCAPCSTATTASCLPVLPIELVQFTGRTEGEVNVLEWSTASEMNTDRFTIERAMEGSDFMPLIEVDAAGNSQALIDYTAIDREPRPGVSFYRLRSADLDGSEQLSDVIAVERDAPGEFTVRPNPMDGWGWYGLPAGTPLPTLLLVRAPDGRIVQRLEAGTLVGSLSPDRLAPGTYLLDQPAAHKAVRFVVTP